MVVLLCFFTSIQTITSWLSILGNSLRRAVAWDETMSDDDSDPADESDPEDEADPDDPDDGSQESSAPNRVSSLSGGASGV